MSAIAIEQGVQNITAERLGVNVSQVTANAKIVEDLGG